MVCDLCGIGNLCGMCLSGAYALVALSMICSIFGSSAYFVVYIFRASCHIFWLSYFLNFLDT